MGKEDIILFGASKLGQIAYIVLSEKYNIIHYCDNDIEKVGTFTNGIEIISVDRLINIRDDIKIFISSMHYREISIQLNKIGKNNFEIFTMNINPYMDSNEYKYLNIKEINLGKFLESVQERIKLEDLTFISGGSGILDYAFLKTLIIKFKISNYLEIGSFIGESISNITDLVEQCYSISLEDNNLEEFFQKKGMYNFSSYFMNGKENIIQYKGDSNKFDYRLIIEKPQLIFIDGDHSYNGVYKDTKKIFDFINTNETIVVWHDFKINDKYRLPVINAIFDALPKKLHNNIYCVDNNLCGIYIPDKHLYEFEFTKEKDVLFSYEVDIKIKRNKI